VDSFFREHARVAVTNGCACGEAGNGHVRFNLAMTRSMLDVTIKRMAAAVREYAHAEPVASR
jgi:cystathionine beta-lyase